MKDKVTPCTLMLLYRAAELGVYGGGSESPTSELNGLPGGDYSGLSELGGYSMGRPDSEDMSELGQRDCYSPVSSIDEIERAVAGNIFIFIFIYLYSLYRYPTAHVDRE